MEFFIADQHFGHKNILDFENRPFETIEEMERSMIEAHNSVVKKTDTVYILGDFCFGGVKQWIHILDQLKGRIVFVKGNHDKTKIIKRVINEGLIHEYHPLGTALRVDGITLNLSHYPMLIGERLANMSVHGHIHSEKMDGFNHINVGVDSDFAGAFKRPFGTPISLDELMMVAKCNDETIRVIKGLDK